MDLRERLWQKWFSLVATFDMGMSLARPGFEDLAAAYSSPDRYYHNLEHIASVLHEIDGLADLAADPAAVQLAAWFHDIVYDSKASDNEDRSAQQLRARGTEWRLPSTLIEEASRLVQLTKSHRTTAEDANGAVMLDADLTILGAPPDEYDRYAAAIRMEYSWIEEAAYRTGRAKVLRGFVVRERLFLLDRMHARYESAARGNLQREIAALSSS